MEAPNAFFTAISETWEKIHADIISHVVAFILVFYIGGTAFPRITLPLINPQIILDNSWFHLAKEMNLLFLGPIFILVLIVAYVAILHALGQVALRLFSSSGVDNVLNHILNEANKPSFEFLALSLGKEDFTINQVMQKFLDLTLKYQIEAKEDFKTFTKRFIATNIAATIYVKNALAFIVAWVAIFLFLPKTTVWIIENEKHFWPVFILLFIFYLVAKIRLNIIDRKSFLFQLATIVIFMKKDKDYVNLQNESDQKRDSIKQRLNEILSDYKRFRRPSLTRYFLNKLYRKTRLAFIHTPKFFLKLKGISNLFYNTGEKFQMAHDGMDRKWIEGYIAYRYYKLCILSKLLKFKITGIFKK